jgi:alpha-soluble NSF attachment protein
MAPQKSEAQVLLVKAEKKAAASTGWFGSSKTKYEEAGDLFQQAANRFKLENSFVEAGDSFAKEAECRENSKSDYEAANAWWNASKSYKQANRPDRMSI